MNEVVLVSERSACVIQYRIQLQRKKKKTTALQRPDILGGEGNDR